MATRRFTIRPQGAFSLRESALFGFGQRTDDSFDGVMRLAFCLDGGYLEQVGVEVRQDNAGVHGIVHGDGDLERVQGQVARVLSLDHDGRQYDAVGHRDPVVRRLQLAAPGLRPPLFYSPYEAAAWSIISARRPAGQMARVRQHLSESAGRVFELAGKRLAALPTPRRLLELGAFAGLTPEKTQRLQGVARAALGGQLEAARLLALGPDEASVDLQKLKGIGGFYAGLITMRGTGFTDILPAEEPRAMALIRELYGLPVAPSAQHLAEISEPWRPFRTWVTVLIRAAAHRLPAAVA